MKVRQGIKYATVLLVLCVIWPESQTHAQQKADVRKSRHNLSSVTAGYTGPARTALSGGTGSTTDQVCVFCHTPHAATSGVTPLWNRAVSGETYVPYSSNTLDSAAPATTPTNSSKLCLSCHDGTIAVGKVNVLNGASNPTIGMTGSGIQDAATGGNPIGAIKKNESGFTRYIGTDLSNDHPISFTYSATLHTTDGDMRPVDTVKATYTSNKTGVRLEGSNKDQLECGSCHDPHVVDAGDTSGKGTAGKFMRKGLNRFQTTDHPTSSAYTQSNDIICLSCHDKAGWTYSAHANKNAANETYLPAAAAIRDFPDNLPVWRGACLNCHDTHTVKGAVRLLRQGSSDNTAGAGGSAIENTCYQCHGTASVLNTNTEVPLVQSDFEGSNKRMPISAAGHDLAKASDCSAANMKGATAINAAALDGGTGSPLDFTKCGKDLIERPTGGTNAAGSVGLDQRHVECSDCHNPHRVTKRQSGLDVPQAAVESEGTHKHVAGTPHTNLISGVLRGSWGVEPVYSATDKSFYTMPTGFIIKRGDPGASPTSDVTNTYVTREYQICLKCHSNYGYDDDNLYPGSTRPALGGVGTASAPNSRTTFTRYTNQAREFRPDNAVGGTGATNLTNNHRSWHPVMGPTGRTRDASLFVDPFKSTGTQTMYCSDCHGSSTGTAQSVVPTGSAPWGPHGSSNNFILKGIYPNDNSTSLLCRKCHTPTSGTSGFCCDNKGNLHQYHTDKMTSLKCNWCHIAVPHGWKNKALLANLFDIGAERGTTALPSDANVAYTAGPYYVNAKLRIDNFATSGSWRADDCQSLSWMTNNCSSAP